jgi:hypothetical protein
LQEALRRAGVSDYLYALPGLRDPERGLESYYFLDDRSGRVVAGAFERGRERIGARFDSEDEACRWLHDELVLAADGPRKLTADEEERAKRNADRLVQEVTALVRRAGQAVQASTTVYQLDRGLIVDQFGQESGTYLYPDGTPFQQRSLPPSLLSTTDPSFPNNYHRYEIMRPFRARAGPVAPAFEQPGGGIQFKVEPEFFAERPPLLTVRWLLRAGYLRRVAAD